MRAAARKVGHHQVLVYREVAEHTRDLNGAHDPALGDRGGAGVGDGRPADYPLPAAGALDAGDDIDEGVLPGPVGSDEPANLAGREPHRDAVVGGEAAIPL